MINSPWLSIWFRPRATIEKIIARNPNQSLWLLATIYGFSSLLNLAQSVSLGETVGVFFILILTLLIAPAWGFVIFSFWSWLTYWCGKLLKGRGEFKAIRAAYSWSCAPLIVNIALWFVLVAIFGKQIFLSVPDVYFTEAQITFLFFILIAKVVLAIWSLVIYLNTLAEVQQFSILRAIGNAVIAAVALALIVSVFWVVFIQLFGASASLYHSKMALQIFRETAFLKL